MHNPHLCLMCLGQFGNLALLAIGGGRSEVDIYDGSPRGAASAQGNVHNFRNADTEDVRV